MFWVYFANMFVPVIFLVFAKFGSCCSFLGTTWNRAKVDFGFGLSRSPFDSERIRFLQLQGRKWFSRSNVLYVSEKKERKCLLAHKCFSLRLITQSIDSHKKQFDRARNDSSLGGFGSVFLARAELWRRPWSIPPKGCCSKWNMEQKPGERGNSLVS